MDERRIRELYDGNPLPPNHALPSLPPLPQTPHHARQSYDDDSETTMSRKEPRSQRRRGGARELPMTVNRVQGLDPGKLSDIGVLTPARLPRSTTLPSLSTESNNFTNKPKEEVVYPTLSTRQSSFNIARTSPTKTDFLTPVRQPSALLHPSSAVRPQPSSSRTDRVISSSFMLPNGGDMTMLQDVTFGDLGRVSLGNDSVDMDFGRQHSYAGRLEDEVTAESDAVLAGVSRHGVSPEKPMLQTAYPRSPFKRSSRPPGQPDRSTSVQAANAKATSGMDERIEAGSDSLATIRDKPVAFKGDTSLQPGSVRRQHPKSSSSHFLAPPSIDDDGDMSTLLPVSPLKTRHLLSDEHMLTRTELNDESTLNISLLIPPTTPGRSHQTAKPSAADGLTMESPMRSPMKTPRSMRKRPGMNVGDVTMDIQQMMARAKVNKAKADMGPEESFVDLLRAELGEDDLNTSMGDDSFIPLTLRPGLVRSKSLSRLEMEKRAMVPLVNENSHGLSISPSRTTIKPRPNSFIERKASADPSPVRSRVAIPSDGVPSRRISLSAGARPFPTSSSMKNMKLPLGRIHSPARTGQDRPMVPSTTIPRSSTLTSLTKPAAKSSMPPPPAPSGRPPQPPKPRTGSTISKASVTAATTRSFTLSRATSVRTASKPPMVPAASSRPTTASRASVKPSQPSTGTFSHATTTGMPRSFGADAMGTSNRTSRPISTASTKAPVKESMGPPAAVATNLRLPSTATASKARTLSTPASIVSRTSRPPTTTTAPMKRLSAAPIATSRSSTIPPSRSTVATTAIRPVTQTAKRSRPPATSSSLDTQRMATIPKSSSTALAAAGLADIRARLDKLQARHQSSKVAR